jgi:hypothetical protein
VEVALRWFDNGAEDEMMFGSLVPKAPAAPDALAWAWQREVGGVVPYSKEKRAEMLSHLSRGGLVARAVSTRTP